ncbi:NAD-dependent epimerase/dehydratase family protein [Candidatus Bathyarchaeota archaeon]|nr:NAD-dependent epimerase/dehydratase family protein [Candidatus Bathyarchaeota archaeon]
MTFDINVNGTLNLLKACVDSGVKRFVYASSCAVYGPRQALNEYSGVMAQFLNRIKNDMPLVIFGDGEQTRDYVYVEDIAEANLLALKCSGVAGEAFNIGTGVATSINRLASILLKFANKEHLKIQYCEAREGDIRHSVADISKAKERLGYNPKVSLENGLGNLLLEN